MSSVNVRNALENALKAMAPLLAASTITTSTVAAATVITTAAPHSLVTGMYVAILGHTGSTPAIDGTYKITVISTTKFSIPKAVTVAGTGGTATAQLTAWENVDFSPVMGLPYQAFSLHFARPDNAEMSASYFERGFFQLDLAYPSQTGPSAAQTRAELVRTAFKFGKTFTSGGVTTRMISTPQIMDSYPDGAGSWVTPVRGQFTAEVVV